MKKHLLLALLLSIGLYGPLFAQEDVEEEDEGIESHLKEQIYPGAIPRPSIYPNTKSGNNPNPTSSVIPSYPPPNTTTGGNPGGGGNGGAKDCSSACGIAGSRACQRCLGI